MKRSIFAAGSLGSILSSPFPAVAQPWRGYYGPGMMWDYGWHGWFWGPFTMIIFWGLLIAGAVLAVRWISGPGTGPRAARTPLDSLKERFARGEIGKDEFEESRRILEN